MYTCLVKLFRQLLSRLDGAVISVVNHNLSTLLKEIPNESLASKLHFEPQGLCFRALLSYGNRSASYLEVRETEDEPRVK